MDATHAQHYAARLTRPDGADGTVWLLAKHHNSTRGAEEAAALVLAVKPSKVVVQLDAKSLHALQDYHKARWHDKTPPVDMAISKWSHKLNVNDLLKVVASGNLQKEVGEFQTAFENALYADSRRHLWGPILDAAVAVGAEIVVADRAIDITKSRVSAALKLSGDLNETVSLGKIVSEQMGPDATGAADAAVKRAVARHGCLKPAEMKSAAYVLIAEAAVFGKVRPENLAAVRACKTLAADIDRDLELITAAPTLRAAGGDPAPACPPCLRGWQSAEVCSQGQGRSYWPVQ